ncbi:MAG: hypothetical protein AAGD25_21920 [Cyanobacteria bacterium P01_F01_bin.150]
MFKIKRQKSISKILTNQKTRTYLGIASVFLASVIVTAYLPIDAVFKGIASLPAVSALAGALFQIFRDQAAYEKQLKLQQKQQYYNLAVTSHMANVAFDKHVEFCEKYMTEVHEAIFTLFREGPTQEVLNHTKKFYRLRSEYAAWLTQDISSQLLPFEETLRRLGSRAYLVKALTDKGYAERQLSANENDQREKAIAEMWSLFEVLDLEKKQEIPDENLAIESIKTRVREILGIEELTKIRNLVIQEAAYQNQSDNSSLII